MHDFALSHGLEKSILSVLGIAAKGSFLWIWLSDIGYQFSKNGQRGQREKVSPSNNIHIYSVKKYVMLSIP